MAKKKKRPKSKKKISNWWPPKNAWVFFSPSYNEDFKKKHPFLYFFTIVGICVCVLAPVMQYLFLCFLISGARHAALTVFQFIAWSIGLLSVFGISVGLCNLLMIPHRQYLGHFITLLSFAIGITGASLGLLSLWLL